MSNNNIFSRDEEVSNKRGVLTTGRQEHFPKSNKRGGSNKACSWNFFYIYYIKTVFVTCLPEINKRGGSNNKQLGKFSKKRNKKNSKFIRDFRVPDIPIIKEKSVILKFSIINNKFCR